MDLEVMQVVNEIVVTQAVNEVVVSNSTSILVFEQDRPSLDVFSNASEIVVSTVGVEGPEGKQGPAGGDGDFIPAQVSQPEFTMTTETFLDCDCTAQSQVITVADPASESFSAGDRVIINRIAAGDNSITVQTPGGTTIFTLWELSESLTLLTTGTEWRII